jgi:amino acid adenylation domain-containing protein
LAVLTHELGVLYQADRSSTPAPLAPVTWQYTDYVHRQAAMVSSPEGEPLWTYWQRQLAGALPVLNLPTDRPRPPVQTYQGASHPFRLDKQLTGQLKAFAKAKGITLYMTLLAAFQVLLSRYTGQDQILVGSPTAGRNWAELSEIVGYFVNPVVLRADLSGDPSFEAFLGQVRQTVLDALEHQDYPFALLVERLQPVRDLSRSPLFQVMFALQTAPVVADEGLTAFALGEPGAQMHLGELLVESVALEQRVAQFDLSLVMAEEDGGLVASLEYNTDLFDAATMRRMAGHFQTLLGGILAHPEQRLSVLPLLTEAERHQLLVEWNSTQADYPRDVCIHQLFEAQAERTPDAVAAVFAEKRLTYGELNSRANQLAHHLRTLGVGPEIRVGICMERSLEMVVGLLGILKVGGAYVPLDPAYPKERLAFMLEDAQVPALLTQQRLVERLPEHGARIVSLDSGWEAIAQQSSENPVSGATADTLAYMIYTSGSTGKPKGVKIPHAGLVNLVTWHQRAYGVTPADRATQLAGPAFDASVWELWPYLTAGASIHIPDEEICASASHLSKWLAAEAISICFLPTPMVEGVLAEKGSRDLPLRALLTGGDKLQRGPRKPLPFSLVNHYGPTENTVVTTCAPVPTIQETATPPPIGHPIANTQIYLLDRHLQPVPIGVPGDLYVGGVGLARGYLNRADLTAAQFIPNAFSDTPGARLYKTGDLVRYLPDGNLEFLGRIDHQVKIRGFRVELGEIEAVLGQHPAVREVVVIAREDVAGDKRLVAYLVATQQPSPSQHELRNFLKEKLPDYMVPAAFMWLDALPLTPNGKVDRPALPTPDRAGSNVDGAFVGPRTPVEQALAGVWAELLGVERVSIHDNFFELGGHSLLATRLLSRLRDAFQVELPLRRLFADPTIAGLACAIEGSDIPLNRGGSGRVQASPRGDKSLDQLLTELEHLSDDEVLALLAPANPQRQSSDNRR